MVARAISRVRTACPRTSRLLWTETAVRARRRSLPRVAGHRAGIESVRIVVDTCARLGIQALTFVRVLASRTGSAREPKSKLCGACCGIYLRAELPDDPSAITSSSLAMGRLEGLPCGSPHGTGIGRVRGDVVQPRPAGQSQPSTTAVARELVDAVKASSKMPAWREGSWKSDDQGGYLARNSTPPECPDPDLLIRTSGEMRISNFLAVAVAYAELYLTETLWPDFRRTDLLRSGTGVSRNANRRFGGLRWNPPSAIHRDRAALKTAGSRRVR